MSLLSLVKMFKATMFEVPSLTNMSSNEFVTYHCIEMK